MSVSNVTKAGYNPLSSDNNTADAHKATPQKRKTEQSR